MKSKKGTITKNQEKVTEPRTKERDRNKNQETETRTKEKNGEGTKNGTGNKNGTITFGITSGQKFTSNYQQNQPILRSAQVLKQEAEEIETGVKGLLSMRNNIKHWIERKGWLGDPQKLYAEEKKRADKVQTEERKRADEIRIPEGQDRRWS